MGWFFPGSPSLLDSYAIEIQEGGLGVWTEVATQSIGAITEYTIEGLSPFTLYGVRAVAIYDISGERVPGNEPTVLTFEAAPTQPPFGIKTTFINSTAQLILWEVRTVQWCAWYSLVPAVPASPVSEKSWDSCVRGYACTRALCVGGTAVQCSL